jgi:hypothetical protein
MQSTHAHTHTHMHLAIAAAALLLADLKQYEQVAAPVMVVICGSCVHHLAKPKSHSLMRGGSWSSSSVLSIFRSL